MKTYILSIAVANYRSFEKLQNPINDSQALIGILENRYQIAESIFLHDEEVSPSAIEQAMRNLNDKIEEDDTLIIVFNGHGKSQEGSNAFYGLLSNSDENNTSTWYDTSRLFNLLLELENIKNMQYIAVIVNACEAGMLFTLPYITNNSADGNSKARLLITAGRGRSTVSDSTITSPNNSPFVAEVVQFLKDNSEEKLSLSSLFETIKERITDNALLDFETRNATFQNDEGASIYLSLKTNEANLWAVALESDKLEDYQTYIAEFRKGVHSIEANKRIEQLMTIRKAWLKCLLAVKEPLNEFIKNTNEDTTEVKFAKRLHERTVKEYEVLTAKEREITSFKNLLDNPNIDDITDFVQQFPNSNYLHQISRMQGRLERDTADDAYWKKEIEDYSGRNSTNKLHRYKAYLKAFGNGKRIDEARAEVRFLEDWIDFENENMPQERRKKLEAMRKKFPKQRQKIERELNKLIGLDIEPSLNKAIAESDFVGIYNIIEHIKGLTETEQRHCVLILQDAELRMEVYEKQRDTDYQIAREKRDIEIIVAFIQKYKKGVDTNKKYVENMIELFTELDEKAFEDAENAQTIEAYQDYYNTFEPYNGKRLADAKQRIKELEYYSKLETEDELSAYCENTAALMYDVAQQRIAEFVHEREREDYYNEVMQHESIALCNIYLSKYLENDIKRKNISEKYSYLFLIQTNEAEDEALWQQINIAQGALKLPLCKAYLQDNTKKLYREPVNEIAKKSEEEVYERGVFSNAEKTGSIITFQNYLAAYPKALFALEANDYIAYLTAKEQATTAAMQLYENEYPQGLNAQKANDCLAFYAARDAQSIELLENYFGNNHYLYRAEGNELLKTLKAIREEEKTYQNAIAICAQTNESLSNKITALQQYLLGSFTYKAAHKIAAEQLLNTLQTEQKDHNDFEIAQQTATKEAYVTYMKTHPDGQHYDEALELSNGITRKEKDVLQAIHTLTAVIATNQQSQNSMAVVATEQESSVSGAIERLTTITTKQSTQNATLLKITLFVVLLLALMFATYLFSIFFRP